jgi:cell division transport system ATP-binding protein
LDGSGATVVQLEGVGMRYGARPALQDVDLRLTAGSFHFVVGPSGAGKTSLLRVLSLSHPPAEGKLVLFGRDVVKLGQDEQAAVRRRIGVVFQDLRLLDHLSAFDNVALPLRIKGASDEQISASVPELLTWLGLGEVMERRPGELSMGQRQLVAVSRAVMCRPSLLLADEPTSSVDEARARRLMHLFLSLKRLGTAILFVTHAETILNRYPFPVLRMEDGRLHPPVPSAFTRSA